MGHGLSGDAKPNIQDHYHLQKVKLGEGAFGTVWRAVDRKETRWVAVKQLDKAALTARGVEDQRPLITKEINMMKELKHQNIAAFIDVFEDADNVFVVLEYCDGGDFGDKVLERGMAIEEVEAAYWMRQVFAAVAFLHSKGVCHRDIKPDNFLICKDALKLADLGLALSFTPGQMMKERCGTPAYMAPEVYVLNTGKPGRGYDASVDIWAAGIFLYVVMFGGKHPFLSGGTSGAVDEKSLLRGALDFREATAGTAAAVLHRVGIASKLRFSDEARRVCCSMVRRSPKDRISAAALLREPWLKRGDDYVVKLPDGGSCCSTSSVGVSGALDGLTPRRRVSTPSVAPAEGLSSVRSAPSGPASAGHAAAAGGGGGPAGRPVSVSIVEASGLPKADWFGFVAGDPYCSVEILNKPETRVQTQVVYKTQSPAWRRDLQLQGFSLGDTLLFQVWDRDFTKEDELLGTAILQGHKFLVGGFEGDLELEKRAGRSPDPSVRATLAVKVRLLDDQSHRVQGRRSSKATHEEPAAAAAPAAAATARQVLEAKAQGRRGSGGGVAGEPAAEAAAPTLLPQRMAPGGFGRKLGIPEAAKSSLSSKSSLTDLAAGAQQAIYRLQQKATSSLGNSVGLSPEGERVEAV